jgi:hypothetical protein
MIEGLGLWKNFGKARKKMWRMQVSIGVRRDFQSGWRTEICWFRRRENICLIFATAPVFHAFSAA